MLHCTENPIQTVEKGQALPRTRCRLHVRFGDSDRIIAMQQPLQWLPKSRFYDARTRGP